MFRRRRLTDVRTQNFKDCRLWVLDEPVVADIREYRAGVTSQRHIMTSLRLSFAAGSTLHQMQGTLQQEICDFAQYRWRLATWTSVGASETAVKL